MGNAELTNTTITGCTARTATQATKTGGGEGGGVFVQEDTASLLMKNGTQLKGRHQVRKFLKGDGRVDVILRPVREENIWFPYWEGARKFAPYFRSAGVGYLRLGDDMGKHGLAFLSTDGGRTFVDNEGFDNRRRSDVLSLPERFGR